MNIEQLTEGMKEAVILHNNIESMSDQHPTIKLALGSIVNEIDPIKNPKEAMIFGASSAIIGILFKDIADLHTEVEQLRSVVNNLASLVADK